MLLERTRGLAAAATLAMMAAALAVAGAARAADSSAPPSLRKVVTDTYHGVQVSDPYRSLEDSADPKVHDWSVGEDKRTRQYLDALPQRERIYRQLLAQKSATSSSYHEVYAAGGQVFAVYDEPPKQQPMIAVLTSDQVVAATLGADDTLYLVSRKGAPRGRLPKLDPGVVDMTKAAVLVPESDAVILSGRTDRSNPIAVTPRTLYLRELVGGPSRVAIFDHAGRSRGVLPLPDVATVKEVEPLNYGTVLYSIETYMLIRYSSTVRSL